MVMLRHQEEVSRAKVKDQGRNQGWWKVIHSSRLTSGQILKMGALTAAVGTDLSVNNSSTEEH